MVIDCDFRCLDSFEGERIIAPASSFGGTDSGTGGSNPRKILLIYVFVLRLLEEGQVVIDVEVDAHDVLVPKEVVLDASMSFPRPSGASCDFLDDCFDQNTDNLFDLFAIPRNSVLFARAENRKPSQRNTSNLCDRNKRPTIPREYNKRR